MPRLVRAVLVAAAACGRSSSNRGRAACSSRPAPRPRGGEPESDQHAHRRKAGGVERTTRTEVREHAALAEHGQHRAANSDHHSACEPEPGGAGKGAHECPEQHHERQHGELPAHDRGQQAGSLVPGQRHRAGAVGKQRHAEQRQPRPAPPERSAAQQHTEQQTHHGPACGHQHPDDRRGPGDLAHLGCPDSGQGLPGRRHLRGRPAGTGDAPHQGEHRGDHLLEHQRERGGQEQQQGRPVRARARGRLRRCPLGSLLPVPHCRGRYPWPGHPCRSSWAASAAVVLETADLVSCGRRAAGSGSSPARR